MENNGIISRFNRDNVLQEEDRVITAVYRDDDDQENKLRPKMLKDYVGQEKVKHNLDVYMHAARKRGDALDHVLLYGPPGLGKTTLAHVIANEMGAQVKVTSGPAIEKALDLSAMLSKLEKGDIVYIDEIHRLNRNIEEILYPAMEDFTIDMVAGAGAMASCLTMNLKPFTLIGSTEREEMVSRHLRERFGMKFRLTHYSIEEMQKFIKIFAKEKNVLVDEDAELEIAKYCEGVPIVAKKMLDRVKDYAEYEGLEKIDIVLAKKAMKNISVEEVHPYKLDEEIK